MNVILFVVMTAITQETVAHIAKLAHLDLSEAELTKFAGDLSAITEAISVLQEVDTTSVEPTLIVNNCPVQGREDEIAPIVTNPEEMLQDCAERGHEIVDNQVVVPSVF